MAAQLQRRDERASQLEDQRYVARTLGYWLGERGSKEGTSGRPVGELKKEYVR